MDASLMSLESLAIALHHSKARGTAKLVLLGIANHDGDGGSWPSVATLARYANVSRRNAQKAVEQLEELHEVRRLVQAGGDHRFALHERPNRYEFLLSCPSDCDRSRHHKTSRYKPQVLEIDPVSDATPPVAIDTRPLSDATPKPSMNQPKTKTEKERRVPNARTTSECGHRLIDDRHCTHGCPTKERTA